MDYSTRRPPLGPYIKRIPLNVTLSPKTHEHLALIGDGNRSAAIEILVEEHMKRETRRRAAEPAVTP